MKKTILILIAISAIIYAEAQHIASYRVNKWNEKVTTKLKETLPASGHLLFAAPVVGLTPVELQKTEGNWQTTATLNPLLAYGIGVGEYSTNPDGSWDVQPYVGLDGFVSGGLSLNSGSIQGSFQLGGLITFYKYFGVGYGYDVASKRTFACTTFKFDIPNFQQGAGFSRIKTF